MKGSVSSTALWHMPHAEGSQFPTGNLLLYIMRNCVLACAGSDEPGEQLWPESEADV